ncbi:hypothetical protein CLF_102092 [Clonorchis sinensis]|uniref:Ig-like domain-containing protein n=1 Tax=Clonorchis sinensis TaxID=79923 RepID=G7Y7A0_CLOSI|nr:hypothetical protein CLF_102092 [Clonorchis sinensis]
MKMFVEQFHYMLPGGHFPTVSYRTACSVRSRGLKLCDVEYMLDRHFQVLLFVIHQTISDTQPSVLLPYLNINGPVHQKSLVNETISLRCHVTVLMSNHSAVVFTPKLNFQNQSSTKWYASTPESLNPTVKLSVQWIKDGFGYDADALLHTFGGRYRMLGSSTKGDFTLTISELTFEDEGEYACQASLVLQSPKLWSSSRTGQDLQKRIPDKDSVRGLTITMLPMSLIKSETASVKIVDLYLTTEIRLTCRNKLKYFSVGPSHQLQCLSDVRWKAVTDIKILPLEVPMDSFTIRCEVNNDWDFSTKEENVAMVNGNPAIEHTGCALRTTEETALIVCITRNSVSMGNFKKHYHPDTSERKQPVLLPRKTQESN